MEQLVLQRLGAGRDYDAMARQQRGHEICKRLARAGTRFDHEIRTAANRRVDFLGHCHLFRARRKPVETLGERSVFTEQLGQILS